MQFGVVFGGVGASVEADQLEEPQSGLGLAGGGSDRGDDMFCVEGRDHRGRPRRRGVVVGGDVGVVGEHEMDVVEESQWKGHEHVSYGCGGPVGKRRKEQDCLQLWGVGVGAHSGYFLQREEQTILYFD